MEPVLPPKEWHKVIDSYMEGKGMDPEDHEGMSRIQQIIIKEIDLSNKRRNGTHTSKKA